MKTSSLNQILSAQPPCDPESMPVARAQQIILQFIDPLTKSETVEIRAALGRVLAGDIVSPIDVPPHDNSAMDGYAVRSSDLRTDVPITLGVVGTSYAGRSFSGKVASGECVRIMTGGVMPARCDTVVPQELTEDASEISITIPAGVVKIGDNRRLQGEDLAAGKPALRKGKILRPADLGLLASLGVARVQVQLRLRVAFFSTGDELRSPGEALDQGSVYDSNRYTLFGMLSRLGCEVFDMGVVKDDPKSLEASVREACETADVIITSGGVSDGDADYTRQILAPLGEVVFWKLAMRPGRPMAFGKIFSNGKSAYFFGLPGNPVAVMLSFYFFARDALLYLMGAEVDQLPVMHVPSQSAIRKKTGRTEYQRGILSLATNGQTQVRITGTQGSGILRSMSEANCILVLPHERGNVSPGELVHVVLFEGLV
jgi:molybdopterin molybdotransferase